MNYFIFKLLKTKMNNLKYSLHKYNYLYDKNKYFSTLKENTLFNYKKIFEYNHRFIYRSYFKYSCLDYYTLDKNNEYTIENKNELKKNSNINNKVGGKVKDNIYKVKI